MAALSDGGNDHQMALLCRNCHSGWVHWIVDVSNGNELWIAWKKKTSTSPNRRERPLILRKWDGVPQTERHMARKRERKREGGCSGLRKSRIKAWYNVEHVETTYFDKDAFFTALASFLLVSSHPSQSCFSCILCNLRHLPLWCVHCFIL